MMYVHLIDKTIDTVSKFGGLWYRVKGYYVNGYHDIGRHLP